MSRTIVKLRVVAPDAEILLRQVIARQERAQTVAERSPTLPNRALEFLWCSIPAKDLLPPIDEAALLDERVLELELPKCLAQALAEDFAGIAHRIGTGAMNLERRLLSRSASCLRQKLAEAKEVEPAPAPEAKEPEL